MRIGFAPWGETLGELVEAARAAEEAGADTVWVSELHRSATVTAAAVIAGTRRVRVGTAIALAFARSPLTTALEALDLDEMSGGRFVLGLGSGVRRLIEDWHDQPFDAPAARMRDTIAIIRLFSSTAHLGTPLIHKGHRTLHMTGYRRPTPPPPRPAAASSTPSPTVSPTGPPAPRTGVADTGPHAPRTGAADTGSYAPGTGVADAGPRASGTGAVGAGPRAPEGGADAGAAVPWAGPPIHVAAVGPVMTRLAGEVADGWISHELGSAEYLEQRILPELHAAGRRPEVVVSACCAVDPVPAVGRTLAAGTVGFYLPVRTYADFFAFHGFTEEHERAVADFRAGRPVQVTDAMTDRLTLSGAPDEIAARIKALPADSVKLAPPVHGLEPARIRRAQAALIDLIGGLR